MSNISHGADQEISTAKPLKMQSKININCISTPAWLGLKLIMVIWICCSTKSLSIGDGDRDYHGE